MDDKQSFVQPPKEKGFIWAYIWCALMFFFGALFFIASIYLFTNQIGILGISINLGILYLLIALVSIADGLGVLYRKIWGLVLTYILIGIKLILTLGQLFYLIVSVSVTPVIAMNMNRVIGLFVGIFIVLVIELLWLGYFYRRRDSFNR